MENTEGKGIELRVDGYFRMTIFSMDGIPVTEAKENRILKKLQKCEYLIGVNSKEIVSLDDYQKPIYKFELDGTNAMEYEFDKY